MSALYRGVLSCYPRWWREQHGEEALGLLLDSAEARGHADPRDLLNLAAHAVRVRLTQSGPPTLIRGIRNRVSVIAVTLLAAISSTFLIFGEWAPWDPQTGMTNSPVANVTTGLFCFLAGLLAAIAMVFDRAIAARWLAAVSAMSALAIMWLPIQQLAESHGFTRPPGTILLFTAVIATLAAAGHPARSKSAGTSPTPRRSRGRFALLVASPSIGAVLMTALSVQSDHWFFYREPGQDSLRVGLGVLLGTALIVVAVVLLLAGHRSWGAALAINSVPWLLLFYLNGLVGGAWTSDGPLGVVSSMPFGGIGVLLAVVLSALVAGRIAVRINRRRQPAGNSVASSE
ncbi:hypothetical protein OHA70_12180 [Kribbella sp. NBC_00382]|uniref:hypothetical protein n=1 Tax=Kribbella sp. NBC_00382 TaxID=2975967 RepID=UPI002E1B8635